MKGIGDMDKINTPTLTLRRERYQQGSLTTEKRSSGPDVWVYRWREMTGRKTVRRKVILGSVKELNKTEAQKKANEYRQLANASQQVRGNSDMTVVELVMHYKERELGENSGKAEKPRKAYLYIFNNYVLPKWGSFPLGAVKAVAVEDWLKTLPLANGSKAKVREVFGAVFRHAIRHELHTKNPIASVRQVRKRAIEPEILEPDEIAAILRELEGVGGAERDRTAGLLVANSTVEVGRRGTGQHQVIRIGSVHAGFRHVHCLSCVPEWHGPRWPYTGRDGRVMTQGMTQIPANVS
jgi:hypothetical protein